MQLWLISLPVQKFLKSMLKIKQKELFKICFLYWINNQLLSQMLSIFRFLERIRLCLTHHRSFRCTQVCCWLQRILSVSAQVSHWQLPGYVSYKHILGVRSFFRFPDFFLNISSELVAKPQTEWSSFDNLFALAISKNSAMYVIVSF